MTVLFKVEYFKAHKYNAFNGKAMVCKISSKNIIAYSKIQTDEKYNEAVVYVADLITPWESYIVCKVKKEVLLLEWDRYGDCLLIVYNGGDIELWKSQSSAINVWQNIYRTSLQGHKVVAVSFFHNGKTTYFNSQKRDMLPFSTCERLNSCPSLSKLGNTPLYGFIVITFTGLVGVYYIPNYINFQNPSESDRVFECTTHSLRLYPNIVEHCNILPTDSGIINICFVYKYRLHTVYCFHIKLDIDIANNVQLRCKKIPQLILDYKKKVKIDNIKWLLLGGEESLIISYNNNEGSFIEQWSLTKKHEQVHSLFKKTNNDYFLHDSWTNISKVKLKTAVKEILLSCFPCDYFPIYVVLADNCIQYFECGLDGLNQLVIDPIRDDRRWGQKIVSVGISALNQLMVIFDSDGYMYAIQLINPFQDKNVKTNCLSMSLALLEYSIKTGIDSSDVLLTNMNLLDILIEKLTDNFTRQQPSIKQYYYSRFLSIKSNISRMQIKHQDFDNLIHLYSIAIAFKSLLRPSDLNPQEKTPGENLSNILNEYTPDIDKVLCNLDARDFTLEPSALQSLQQIIQWVSDLTIVILNKLPEEAMKPKSNKKLGYELCRDIMAINTIRELLVIIRIWGLLNFLCLPVYTKSVGSVDVLPTMFKILTRLAQNGCEPDDIILDECNHLSSQVLTPMKISKTTVTVLGTNNCNQKNTFFFNNGVDNSIHADLDKEKIVLSKEVKDGVTNIILGPKCTAKIQCVRCGFINTTYKIEKTSAMKAWCNRWSICHCGGLWKSTTVK